MKKIKKKDGWNKKVISGQTFHDFIWFVLMPIEILMLGYETYKVYTYDASVYHMLCSFLFAAGCISAVLSIALTRKRRAIGLVFTLITAPLAVMAYAVEISTDIPNMTGSTSNFLVLFLVNLILSIIITKHFITYRRQYFGLAEPEKNTEPLPIQDLDYVEKTVEYNASANAFRIMKAENKAGGIHSSKIGGIPYWRPEQAFPADSGGRPMKLLMQINFPDEDFEDARAPKKGILQLYVSDAVLSGQVIGDVAKSDFKAVYHIDVDPTLTAREALIGGASESPETVIAFEKYKDRITGKDIAFDENLAVAVNNKVPGSVTEDEISTRFPAEQYEEIKARFRSPGSKFLGYADFIGEDPREKGSRHNLLLAQLDLKEIGIAGPSVIYHFFINTKAFSAKNFDGVILNIENK